VNLSKNIAIQNLKNQKYSQYKDNALEKRDAEIKEFDDREKMRIQKNKDKAEAERLSREGYDRVR
jgi:hypothetical protein